MRATDDLIRKLEETRLNLSHFYLLEKAFKGEKVAEFGNLSYTLERKSLIEGGSITVKGRELYEALMKGKSAKTHFEGNKGELFEEWWKHYPATDRVKSGEKVLFESSRALRAGRESCKQLYFNLLEQYKHEDMLNALKYEISMRHKQSLQGDNAMKFMKGSIAYLRARGFEAFIEISKEEPVKEKKYNTTI